MSNLIPNGHNKIYGCKISNNRKTDEDFICIPNSKNLNIKTKKYLLKLFSKTQITLMHLLPSTSIFNYS